TAFSRATRIRRYIQHITKKRKLEAPWRFEVAAMMSQLGCVTLPPDLVEAVYAGQKLSPEEQARFDAHPAVARDLLSNIPRMEPIAWMIAEQHGPCSPQPLKDADSQEAITQGAQMLKVALAYDQLVSQGQSHQEALQHLRDKSTEFDRAVVADLADLQREGDRMEVRDCAITDLESGMILQKEVRTHTGLLVVAKGQEVTYPLLVRLRNFWQRGAIGNSVIVLAVPRPASAATASGHS
ncbi:MAG: hypothetical protein DMG71_10635, partial [Acidobacteria bacterium]